MSDRYKGYSDGYMHKTAFIGGAVKGAAKGTAKGAWEIYESYIIPALILGPALAGIGAGALHSKVTSPSNLDKETAQKAIEVAELEEFNTSLKRRKEQDMLHQRLKQRLTGGRNERSLHI